MATLYTDSRRIPPAEIKRIVLIVSTSAEDDVPDRPPLEESLPYQLLARIAAQREPGESYACWRIYTAQSAQTARALEDCFGDKFQFDKLRPIGSVDDVQGIFTTVMEIAAEPINQGQTVFCECTGGTKTISIALALACNHHALTSETNVKLVPTFVRSKDTGGEIVFYPFDLSSVLVEEQLRYVEQQKRIGQLQHLARLSPVLAHEIKNPLNLISADLFLLQSEPLSGRAKELLREMESSVRGIEKIISSIQQAARAEADSYRQRAIHLSEVMRRIQARTTKRFPELSFEISGNWSGIQLRIPEEKLYSIFTNLIDNAAYASEGKGRLRIDFSTVGDQLRVSVEDDGPGIPPEQRADLFKPLHRGKNSLGTGMGLSIVKAFVTEEGGTISYDHSYLAGARFLLELPISTNERNHDQNTNRGR
jgi:signal transduction histidine kinase